MFSENGPGLADDVRELLFEPMTSAMAKRMGIGLSISKSLIEADCGRIWAESDTGATFSYALPLTAAEIEE
jgi:nitrogen-specific signal transduction histidine kinase